jgi:hypothetical protein
MQEAERQEGLGRLLQMERDREKRLTLSDQQLRDHLVWQVKRLARQESPVTTRQYSNLDRELMQARELAAELARSRARLQGLEEARQRADQLEQALEREQALAMVQARSLARAEAQARAQARSARLRSIASARFLWRLLQAQPGLWDGMVRNLHLGMSVVALLAWILPKTDRERWRQDSYNWLEELKQEGSPLLGTAIRIALRTPWLALVLWTLPTRRLLARLKALWIGLGTAAAVLSAGIAGISQSPPVQVGSLLAAALLAGAVATSQAFKGRQSRRRRRGGKRR